MVSRICDKYEMDVRPGGAAEPPAPEAHGAGGGLGRGSCGLCRDRTRFSHPNRKWGNFRFRLC